MPAVRRATDDVWYTSGTGASTDNAPSCRSANDTDSHNPEGIGSEHTIAFSEWMCLRMDQLLLAELVGLMNFVKAHRGLIGRMSYDPCTPNASSRARVQPLRWTELSRSNNSIQCDIVDGHYPKRIVHAALREVRFVVEAMS